MASSPALWALRSRNLTKSLPYGKGFGQLVSRKYFPEKKRVNLPLFDFIKLTKDIIVLILFELGRVHVRMSEKL